MNPFFTSLRYLILFICYVLGKYELIRVRQYGLRHQRYTIDLFPFHNNSWYTSLQLHNESLRHSTKYCIQLRSNCPPEDFHIYVCGSRALSSTELYLRCVFYLLMILFLSLHLLSTAMLIAYTSLQFAVSELNPQN